MKLINKHIKEVANFVADNYDMSFETLVMKSRLRNIVFPRQIAMYLCRKYVGGASLAQIGAIFGGKDHATVLYAYRNVEGLIESKTPEGREVLLLESKFKEDLLPLIRKYNLSSTEKYEALHEEYDIQKKTYDESVELMYATAIDALRLVNDHVNKDAVMEGWRREYIKSEILKSKGRLRRQKDIVTY